MNYDETHNEENPATKLVRFEFVELIVRIAQKMYASIEHGAIPLPQAIEKIVNNHLVPCYEHDLSFWVDFREKQLHSIDVQDMFI